MRRYPQFRSTPSQVSAMPSVGSAPNPAGTVARRRYAQFGRTLGLVTTLPQGAASTASATRRPGTATLRTGWTGTPDNTTIQTNINEAVASDAAYITSPVINGSQGPARFEIVDGDSGTPSPLPAGSWDIPFRANEFNGSAEFRLKLLSSGMAVLGTGAWQPLTGTYTDYTSTITIASTATHIELEVQ